MDLYNIIGFSGTIVYLLSFYLLQSGKIDSGKTYIWLNILGAILVSFSFIKHFNAPSLVTQICWILIGLYGFYNISKKEKAKRYSIVFDDRMDYPKFIAELEETKIVALYLYENKNIWKELELSNNILINEGFSMKKAKQPSFTNPPPLRNEPSHFDDIIEVYSRDNCLIYRDFAYNIK